MFEILMAVMMMIMMKITIFWDVALSYLLEFFVPEECHLLGCYTGVALVRTDVLGEVSAFIIRVTRICELGTLAVNSN
jgi:hypothetical protein